MEVLIGILSTVLEIFAEALLVGLLEGGGALLARGIRGVQNLLEAHPWLALLMTIVVGGCLGFLSTLLFPHSVLLSLPSRIMSVVLGPLVAAGSVFLWDKYVTRKEKSDKSSFVYVYLFALSVGLVRFMQTG